MLSADSILFERAFNVLNRVYFENSLPETVITIQSSPKSYGYITVHKVWKDSKNSYHEINISAEHLNRNIENILATLLHEMVHLYCMVNNISDTSNGGRYHNKRFKEEAEKRDLFIEYAQYIGYSKTSPSDKFIRILKENNLCMSIDHCRNEGSNSIPPSTGGGNGRDLGKKKTSTRKYICNICGDCMYIMVKSN